MRRRCSAFIMDFLMYGLGRLGKKMLKHERACHLMCDSGLRISLLHPEIVQRNKSGKSPRATAVGSEDAE